MKFPYYCLQVNMVMYNVQIYYYNMELILILLTKIIQHHYLRYVGKGFYNCALSLLQAGALVDKQDSDGVTPLHVASGVGQLKCVVMLVEHGADVNKCALMDETPLMACATYGRFQVMSYLLAHGANVNAVDKKGHYAIQTSHLFGHSKCVELLLEYGADESSLQGLKFGFKREVYLLYIIKLFNYKN